jgi:GntR family transcriptional regulator
VDAACKARSLPTDNEFIIPSSYYPTKIFTIATLASIISHHDILSLVRGAMLKSARLERKTLTESAQQELRLAIVKGIFPPGSQMPIEAELCAMLGVSRTVVREALRMLEDEGLIARRHGVGTFVRNRPILKNLNFNFGITEMIESAGSKAGTSHFAIQKEAADAEKAEHLRVTEGTPLITVERVRTADGRPVVYSLDTLTESLIQRVDFNPEALLSESIYSLMQRSLGNVIEYGVARLLPVAAPRHVSEKLQLPPDAITLYIVQTDYNASDEPLIYSCEYHLPDAFDFMVWRRGPTRVHNSPNDVAQ